MLKKKKKNVGSLGQIRAPSQSTLKHKGSPNLGPYESNLTTALYGAPIIRGTPLGSEPQPPALTTPHTRNLSTTPNLNFNVGSS